MYDIPKHFTLIALLNGVRDVLAETIPDVYWVEAELMEIRESRGHCYMELVQKDDGSNTPVARCSAKCWQSVWGGVKNRFASIAGSVPMVGMKLLLQVKVEFHSTYGFSLIVRDIDAAFTLGKMALHRQEVIAQLKAEGVYDLQRTLVLPLFCQHIAVISSETAAGYGDFCNQILNNEYGLDFHLELFPAVMQGDMITQSVVNQLDVIASRADEFQCVVIIRGGGATSDMSGFDSLELAENVANFPLPVITGIGHDRDECVLDLISFQRVKTPTAAAAFLVNHLANVIDIVEGAQNTVLTSVTLMIDRHRHLLDTLSSAVVSSVRLFSSRGENKLERLMQAVENATRRHVDGHKYQLELLCQRVSMMDPKVLLKRGYSMTLSHGKIVHDASTLADGDEIETILQKGKVKSIVKK